MLVLVVDDEPRIRELLKYSLGKCDFVVETAADSLTALEMARRLCPVLIVLDLMLPGKDGFEVCRTLRETPETADIPMIMLTARNQEMDKVLGLELGADDYLTKPFSPRKLVARVKAQLRRAAGRNQDRMKRSPSIVCGELTIHPDRHQVFRNSQEIVLSRKEFSLLLTLASRPGQVFTREKLLELVWDYGSPEDTRTVDVHIRYLRRKLEFDPAKPQIIQTVRGVGYRFQDRKIL
jgi:DNA-binding response OmpR family regulator